MQKFLRYLRIPFATTCGIACMLLIALWVRTKFACDSVSGPLSTRNALIVTSRQGGIGVGIFYNVAPPDTWRTYTSLPDTESSYSYPTTFGFGMLLSKHYHSSYIVRLPYWSLILVFGGIVVLTWKRGSPRFSLRTLLITISVAAAVLGVIVWQARK